MTAPSPATLLDVDGTLVDSNDAHALAWVRAFEDAGVRVDPDHVRRSIGRGGDKLMPAVSGIREDSPEGQAISARRAEIFKGTYLPRLSAFPRARDLVAAVKARGLTTVTASSAKKDELQGLLRVAGVAALLDAVTSSDDAEESKPDPDILRAALERVRVAPAEAVMLGDTPYDVEAANRSGVEMIALRCGGWRDEDLRGAVAIYDGPWDLLQKLQDSPLGRR